jgi:hypothetical protein
MAENIDLFDEFGDDVGLDPEDKKHIQSANTEWFKGDKGRTYRVALLYFHPLEISVMRAAHKKDPTLSKDQLLELGKKALAKRAEERSKAADQLGEHEKLHVGRIQFHKIKAYYHEIVKYVQSRLGLDGTDADKVWNSLGEEKTYFTTCIVIYPTDKDGEVNRDLLGKGWTVKPWRFASKVYERLHQVGGSLRSNDLSIATQDLKLKCTNGDFQNFDIDGAGKAIWLKNDKLRDAILAAALKLYPDVKKPFREMSTADVRIKLGLDSGNSGDDVSDDEFDDVLADV